MIRRLPLWLTLLPLVAGVGLYWLLWSGWARDFSQSVAAWLPGSAAEIGGFPYRLEATLKRPNFAAGDVVHLSATASRVQINRGPWQPDLTVITAEEPRFAAIVGPLISASLSGKSATTSVHVESGRLLRLSTVVAAARLRLGLLALPITADSLEIHLREPDAPAVPATSPTGAARGEVVIAGQRLRFAGGDALTLAASMMVTGAARLNGYDRWATTGTIELTRLTLADAHGDLAIVVATVVPQGRHGLRYAGTIETICPASIAAAIAGTQAPSEKRLRTPVRLAFSGIDRAMRLASLPADLAQRSVKGQLPDCPRLRA